MNAKDEKLIFFLVLFKYEALNRETKHKEVTTMIKKCEGRHVHEISEPIFQT